MISGSRFERVLNSGRFAVTAELAVLDSADPQDVYDRALVLSSVCDGINATDAAAVSAASFFILLSTGSAKAFEEFGVESARRLIAEPGNHQLVGG